MSERRKKGNVRYTAFCTGKINVEARKISANWAFKGEKWDRGTRERREKRVWSSGAAIAKPARDERGGGVEGVS